MRGASRQETAARASLRIGISHRGPVDANGWRRARALAELAESLALDSMWLPESHFRVGATASPLLGLAALAACTRHLRLGTTSLLISIHDPLRVATEVRTLDLLSGGRVLLGLGRGFERSMFRGLGIDPRSKRDRFDEALDTILAVWSGGGPGTGRARLVADSGKDSPPLLVAAFGRKGLLQAATRGLPYLASPLEGIERLCANYALHREHLPAHASPEARGAPVMRTLHVAADASEAARVREAVRREWEQFRSLGSPTLERAAAGPLEERVLVGEPSEVAEGIEVYRERLGMDLLIVRPVVPVGAEEQQASLRRLVERVLPHLS